jgi:ABC-type uncharacterized transport system fused permease/ATPase subunit
MRLMSKVLAAGELQALTFARLLLASPRFAFLDDPVKIIAAPVAERLYQALARSSITYIRAGCPPALRPYHDIQLADRTGRVAGTAAPRKRRTPVNESLGTVAFV